jgi:uncharacterized protein (TIGR02996 family)
MNTEDAFYADIVEHPDDDTPRLIFADWLEEAGRVEQAEFIRLQCQLARLDDGDARLAEMRCREQYLFARHSKGWVRRNLRRKIENLRTPWGFRRGMIESVRLSGGALINNGPELFATFPIRHLSISALHELNNGPLPDLSRVTELTLSQSFYGSGASQGGLARLLDTLNPAVLRVLNLDTSYMSLAHWQTLAARLDAKHLEQLRFNSGNQFGLGQIIESPALTGLKRLDLQGQVGGTDVLPLLSRLRTPGQLRELSLEFGYFNAQLPQARIPSVIQGIMSLFGQSRKADEPRHPVATLLSGLRKLCLRQCQIVRTPAFEALCRSPALAALHTLILEPSNAPMRMSPSVFTLPHFAGLTTLQIPDTQMKDDAFAELVSSPTLSRLTTLDVARAALTEDSMYRLIESPTMQQLRCLSLRGNRIGEGLWALIESDLFTKLGWLDLRNTELTDAHARMLLARADKLTNLAWLDLRENDILPALCHQLRQVFGPTVRTQRPSGG